MKTEELISMLATGVAPIPRNVAAQRLRTALTWGSLGAFLTMALVFGVRHDLRQAAELPMFWVKLGFPAVIAGAALMLVLRLSHPGMRTGAVWLGLALPWLAVLSMAAMVLVEAPADQRSRLILGTTWETCAFNIALVSIPVFVAVLWAMKGLAPTRLTLAGASAGLLAGAVGTVVYALHCPESAVPFMAIWYVAGMLIPTAVGAWLGPRVLRW
jgi:hypothetical protein